MSGVVQKVEFEHRAALVAPHTRVDFDDLVAVQERDDSVVFFTSKWIIEVPIADVFPGIYHYLFGREKPV